MSSKIFMSVFVPLSILLPITLGLIKFKFLPSYAKLIWYYLIVAGLINTLAAYIGRTLHKNTMPLVHILTVFEIFIFAFFFKKIISDNKVTFWNKFIPIIFTGLCVFIALFYQNIFSYNSYARSIEAIIIMLFSMNYFAKLASESLDQKSYLQPSFFFNVGLFLYFSGAFILFVFSNFTILTLSRSNFDIIWTIHAALVLIMYLIFSIGFILCKK